MGERDCKFRFGKKKCCYCFLNVICIFVKRYLSGQFVFIRIYLFKKHQIQSIYKIDRMKQFHCNICQRKPDVRF